MWKVLHDVAVLSQLIRSLPITTVEPILLATACHPPCITGTADLHMCIKSQSMHTFTQKPCNAGTISLLLLRSLFISCNSSYTSSCRQFLAPCLPWKCYKGGLSNAIPQEDKICTCQVFRTPVLGPYTENSCEIGSSRYQGYPSHPGLGLHPRLGNAWERR